MNVLLIYPKYPTTTFWSFSGALRYISRKAAFPPLGLLTIASILPTEWAKKLADENVAPITDSQLAWADMVFVSAMIVQKSSALAVIERCKAFGKTVVAGGPLFNAEPEKFPEVDHLVLGEAEVTLPLFLEDLASGSAKHKYSSGLRPDITATPLPMWALIRLKDYATMLVQYSRGCPYDCEFCDITVMNGRVPRVKTPRQMMAELQLLFDLGYRGAVFVVDDNFIGNKRAVKQMLVELVAWQKRHRYPFKFFTEASVNLADDDELLGLMSLANFGDVFLGLETPCMDSLKEAGKTQNTSRDLREAVIKIQRRGLHVMGGFMVGFDNDKAETIFRDQFEFIQAIGVPMAMVGIVMAIPGTRLWHRLRAEGRLLLEANGDNTSGQVNFLPTMGLEKLVKGHRELLLALFSAKSYFARIETLIKNYRPKTRSTHLSWNELLAVVKSLWFIGIWSGANWRYWKLLIKTSGNLRAFPVVVKNVIYWDHLHRVARSVQSN
ncbi:MAG: B12-binding domain-containing radical SAM protein [Candidatus Doudnabacteria bacterium]|nr:B12-binding domain-containing radical SAM protein [Candidatus Doudnabacteria bacterium]